MFDSNFNFPDNYCPILAHSHVDRHCRCCLALHCNLYHISIFDSVCFLYLLASVLLAYFHAWPSLPSVVNNCCSLPPILNWIDARHGFPSSTLCCSFCQLFDAPYTIIGIDQICRSPGSDRMSQFCTVTLPSPWVLQKKTLPPPWASKTQSHRAIASANPNVLGCLLCCCGRLLAALFFINVIISSGFSLFNSRIWYGLFGLVVFDMDSLS